MFNCNNEENSSTRNTSEFSPMKTASDSQRRPSFGRNMMFSDMSPQFICITVLLGADATSELLDAGVLHAPCDHVDWSCRRIRDHRPDSCNDIDPCVSFRAGLDPTSFGRICHTVRTVMHACSPDTRVNQIHRAWSARQEHEIELEIRLELSSLTLERTCLSLSLHTCHNWVCITCNRIPNYLHIDSQYLILILCERLQMAIILWQQFCRERLEPFTFIINKCEDGRMKLNDL